MHSRIAGTGRYLPERVLTNDELALSVATSDEWIRTRTGIRQRHVAADGQLTSDLALAAARRALDAATTLKFESVVAFLKERGATPGKQQKPDSPAGK